MLLSILLLIVITTGGFAITYLVEREEPLLWRAAAGTVVGSALFGTILFLFGLLAGLSAVGMSAAVALTASPIVLIFRGPRRKIFENDWARAKGKIQGASGAKGLRFAYYAGFLLLFVFFFDRAMIETQQGIFTGGSNNLGDLPFHLGAIYAFADGMNFPPQNPNFAGAKFSYPFIADLITAGFVKLGIRVRDAMFVQNVAWAFSLLVILEHFVRRLAGDKLAGKLAPPILLFSGGLGFLWFFSDFYSQGLGFFGALNNLSKDYTIGDEFRWGNSLITLFLTQRSLLLGMPITLVVLGFLWNVFVSEGTEEPRRDVLFAAVVTGLIAGLLPLIHLHSLVVLFVVTGVLLLMKWERRREFAAFGIGVSILAVPALLWSMSGSATRVTEFLDWHFGFDSRDTNILWFWIKNTGLFIPLIAFGVYLVYFPQSRKDAKEEKGKRAKDKRRSEEEDKAIKSRAPLIKFYLPFVFLFVIANVAKLAPWEWDNIKVLIYWFVGSIPFVALAIAWMWRRAGNWKLAAGMALFVLVAAGSLDVWRTVSRQINYQVFDADAMVIADRIRAVTPPRSLFLNAPTYNTAVVLTGRRSLMRYTGHLSSHGIDFGSREEDVKRIYRGGPDAGVLLEKYGIEYVLISPMERGLVQPNEAFFNRYPVVAESGAYRVYRVSK